MTAIESILSRLHHGMKIPKPLIDKACSQLIELKCRLKTTTMKSNSILDNAISNLNLNIDKNDKNIQLLVTYAINHGFINGWEEHKRIYN